MATGKRLPVGEILRFHFGKNPTEHHELERYGNDEARAHL